MAEGTLDRDPKWANNKRLESHGLALTDLTDRQASFTAPGAHAPLARAQGSLFAASRQLLRNLASLGSSRYVRF
ncbi:MAG: hypothetical protein IPM23_02875 [Candidatus Melainabacteria bacterium]|nr:hypothetical protein [Candidatus Melainabacteria bacterium]